MFILRSSTFWVWLLTTVTLIVLALVYRRPIQVWLATGRPLSLGTLILMAILLAIVGLRATPTGDEPHYLIITQSFLQDGDFDLRNNYQKMDYLEYYPGTIPDPHVTIVGNHWYPVHGIGLPILTAPFFAVGGRPGVVVIMALITVAGIRVLWSIMQRAALDPKGASLAALTAVFTLPLASLSGQIFPEVPAFLLVALSLRAVVGPALIGWDFVALLLSLAIFPWLHPKHTALAAALLLSAALCHPRRGEILALTAACGLLFLSVAGLALLSTQWYGVPLPGAPIMMAQAPFDQDWLIPLAGHFFSQPWVGLAGVLFDQQSGLFMASPVYLLAIPGILFLWHRNATLAIACALIFASVYLPAGSFVIWYGGFSSPARLLTPAVPVLALGVASALDAGGQRSRMLFKILSIPSVLLAYLMATLPSFTRYGDPASQHNYFIALFEQLTHLDLTVLFPSFRNVGPTTWLTTGVYLLAIIVICILLIPQNSQRRVKEG